ncbi:hypothetical protein [Shewanella surugensis]|uniref:Secreted protein n=1 Tax=Shewanella surugensis TaxID=212020 RepID=A0ABT0L8D7_9GAMM|nr:hypothetical protein [Shewanella surugensis]MCL1123441.1 hypothetical protein [Shewanella surugensis]
MKQSTSILPILLSSVLLMACDDNQKTVNSTSQNEIGGSSPASMVSSVPLASSGERCDGVSAPASDASLESDVCAGSSLLSM